MIREDPYLAFFLMAHKVDLDIFTVFLDKVYF